MKVLQQAHGTLEEPKANSLRTTETQILMMQYCAHLCVLEGPRFMTTHPLQNIHHEKYDNEKGFKVMGMHLELLCFLFIQRFDMKIHVSQLCGT